MIDADALSPAEIERRLRALFDAAQCTPGLSLVILYEEQAPGAAAILTAWGAEKSLEVVTRTIGRRTNTSIYIDGDRHDITVLGVEV